MEEGEVEGEEEEEGVEEEEEPRGRKGVLRSRRSIAFKVEGNNEEWITSEFGMSYWIGLCREGERRREKGEGKQRKRMKKEKRKGEKGGIG